MEIRRRVPPAAAVAAADAGGTDTAGAAADADSARVTAAQRLVVAEVRRPAVWGAAGGDGATA